MKLMRVVILRPAPRYFLEVLAWAVKEEMVSKGSSEDERPIDCNEIDDLIEKIEVKITDTDFSSDENCREQHRPISPKSRERTYTHRIVNPRSCSTIQLIKTIQTTP